MRLHITAAYQWCLVCLPSGTPHPININAGPLLCLTDHGIPDRSISHPHPAPGPALTVGPISTPDSWLRLLEPLGPRRDDLILMKPYIKGPLGWRFY